MKMKKSKNNSGPSSAIGIMKFKDEMSSFTMNPHTFVIIIVVLIVLILIVKAAFSL